ncbi:hypothetical protein pb186bvf_017829 [Paramecium bursaria]
MNEQKEGKDKLQIQVPKVNDKQKDKNSKSVTSKRGPKSLNEMVQEKIRKTEAGSTEAQSEISQVSRVSQRKGTTTTVITTQRGQINQRIQSEHKLPPLQPNQLPGGGYSPAGLLRAKEKFVQEQKLIQQRQREKQQKKDKQQQEKQQMTEQLKQSSSPIKQEQIGEQQQYIQEFKVEDQPLLQQELGQINELDTQQSHSDRSYTISKSPEATPPQSQRNEEYQALQRVSEQSKTDNSPRPQFSENLPTINEKSESQQFTSPKFESQSINLAEIQTSKFQVEVESNQVQVESKVIQVEIIKQSVVSQSSQEQFVTIERSNESEIISNTQNIVSGLIQQYTTKAIGQQLQEVEQLKDKENLTQITITNTDSILVQRQVINQIVQIEEGQILQNQLEQNQISNQTQDPPQIQNEQLQDKGKIEQQIDQEQINEQQGQKGQTTNDDDQLGNPFGNYDEEDINQIQLYKEECLKNKNKDQSNTFQGEVDKKENIENQTSSQDTLKLEQQNIDQNQNVVVLENQFEEQNKEQQNQVFEEKSNQENQKHSDKQVNDDIKGGAFQGQQEQGDQAQSQQNIQQQQDNNKQQENEKQDDNNKQKSQIEEDDDLGNPLGEISEEEIKKIQEIKSELQSLQKNDKQEDKQQENKDEQQENEDIKQENDKINNIQSENSQNPDKLQQNEQDLQKIQDTQNGQIREQIEQEQVNEQQGQKDQISNDDGLGNPFGNQDEGNNNQIQLNKMEYLESQKKDQPQGEVDSLENIQNQFSQQDAQQQQQIIYQNQDVMVLGNPLGQKNRKVQKERNQENQQHSDQKGNDDINQGPIKGQQDQGDSGESQQNIPQQQENNQQQNQQSENEKQDDDKKQKSPSEEDDDIGNPLGEISEEEIKQIQKIKSEVQQLQKNDKQEDEQQEKNEYNQKLEINDQYNDKSVEDENQKTQQYDLDELGNPTGNLSQDQQHQIQSDKQEYLSKLNKNKSDQQVDADQQGNSDNQQDQSQDQQVPKDHTDQQQKESQQENNGSENEQSEDDIWDSHQQKSQISDEKDLGNPLGNTKDEEITEIQKNKSQEQKNQLEQKIESNEKEYQSKDTELKDPFGNRKRRYLQDNPQKDPKIEDENIQKVNQRGKLSEEDKLGNPLGNLSERDIKQIQENKQDFKNNEKDQNIDNQISQKQEQVEKHQAQLVSMNIQQNQEVVDSRRNIGNPLEQTVYAQSILSNDENKQKVQMGQQQISRYQSISSVSKMTESVETFEQIIESSPKIIPIVRSNTFQVSVQRSTNKISTYSVGGNHNENNSQDDQTSIQRNISQQQTIIYQNIEIQNEIVLENEDINLQQQFPQQIHIQQHQLNQLEQEIFQFDVQIDQESQLQFILNVNALDKRELEKLFKSSTDQEQKAAIKHLLKLNQIKEDEAINFIKSDINFRNEYDDPFKNAIIVLLQNLDDILNTELQDLKQESLDDVVGRVTLPQTQKFIERIPQMVEAQIDTYKENLQKEIENIEHLNEQNLDDPVVKQVYDKIQQYQQRQQEDQQVIEQLKQEKFKQEQVNLQLQQNVNNNPPQFQNIQQGLVQLNDLKVDLLFELNKQSHHDNEDLKELLDKFNDFRVQQYQKSQIQQDYSLNQLIEQYQIKSDQLQFIYAELSQLNLIKHFEIVNEENISKYFIILQQFKDFLISQEQDDDPNADPHLSLQEILKRREQRQQQEGNKNVLSQIFEQISSVQILRKYQKVDFNNYEEFFKSLDAFKLLTLKQYNRVKIEDSLKLQDQEQEQEQLQDQDGDNQQDQQENLLVQNKQISLEECVQEIEDSCQNLKDKYQQIAIEYQQLTLEHQQQQNRIKDVFEDIISDYQENNQQRYIYLRQDYLQNFVDKFHDSMIDFFKNQQTNPQQIQNIQNILLQIRQHQQEVIDIFTVDDEFKTNNEGLKQFIQAFNLKRQQKLSEIDQNIAHYNLDQAFESIYQERKTLQDKINAFKKTIDQNTNQYLPSPKKQEKKQEFSLQDDQNLSEEQNLVAQQKRQLDAYEIQNIEMATKINEFNKILGENDADIYQIQKVKDEICQMMKIQENKSLQELLKLVKQEISLQKQNQKGQIDQPPQNKEIEQKNTIKERMQAKYIPFTPRGEKGNQQDQDIKDVDDINQNTQKQELQDYIKLQQKQIKKLKLQINLLEDENKKFQKEQQISNINSILPPDQNDDDNQIDPKKEKQLDDQHISGEKQYETPTELPPQDNNQDIPINELQQEIKRLNEENDNLRQLMQGSQNMEQSMLKIKLQENEKIIEDKNEEMDKIQLEKQQQEQFLAQQRIQIAQLQQELQNSLNQIQTESEVNKKLRDELIQQINQLKEQQVQDQIQNKKDIEEFCANLFQGANSHENLEYSKNQIIKVFHQSFNKVYYQKLSEINIQKLSINELIEQFQRLHETIAFIFKKLTIINIDEYQEININNIQQFLLSVAQYRTSLNSQISLKQLLINKDTQNHQQEKIIQEQKQQIEDYKNNFEQLQKEKLQQEKSLNQQIHELSQQLQKIAQLADQQNLELIELKQDASGPQTNRTVSDHNLDQDNDKTLIDKVIQDLKKINYFDLTNNKEDQYQEFIDGFLAQKVNAFNQYNFEQELSINDVLKKVQQINNNSMMEQLRKTRYFNNVDVHNIQEKINEFVKEEQVILNVSLKARDWQQHHQEILNDIDSLKDNYLKSALNYLTRELDKVRFEPKEKHYEQASYQNLIDQIQKMEQDMQSITKKEMVQDPLDSAQYLKPGINPKYYIIENLRMGFQMLKDNVQVKLPFYQLDHVRSFERLIEILVDKLLMYREKSQKPKEQQNSNIPEQFIDENLNSLFEIKDLRQFLEYDYKSTNHSLLSNGLEKLQNIINQYLNQQEERLLELELASGKKDEEESQQIIDRIEEIQPENEMLEPYDRVEKAFEMLKQQIQNLFDDYYEIKSNNPISQFKSQLMTQISKLLELNQQNAQYLNILEVKKMEEQYNIELQQMQQTINMMEANFKQILNINTENIIWNLNDVPENDSQYVQYTAIYNHFRSIYLTILQFHENEINKINVVTLDDYIQNENPLIYAVIKKLQISQDLLKQQIASDYYNLLDNLDPFEENMDQDPLKVKLSEVLKKYRKEYDIKCIGLKEFQLWQQKIQIHDFKNGQYQYQEQDTHKKRYIQIIESLLAQYDQEIIEWIKQLSFSQGEVDQHRDIHRVFMEKFKDYYFARIASQDKVPIIKKKDGVDIETLVPVRYLQTNDYSLKIKQIIELAQLLGQDSVNCFIGLYNSLKKIMKNQKFLNEIEQNSAQFTRIINLFQQKQEEIYEKMKYDQRFEQMLCGVENLLQLNSVSVLKLQLILDQYVHFVAASSKELYKLNPLTIEGALQMV